MARVIIEDEWHSEQHGEFSDLVQAMAELKLRAEIPWNEPPNLAPCMSWRTCVRAYDLIEYDDSVEPWKELRRRRVLEVTASGVKWID